MSEYLHGEWACDVQLRLVQGMPLVRMVDGEGTEGHLSFVDEWLRAVRTHTTPVIRADADDPAKDADRIDRIILEVGRLGFCLSRHQRDALELLGYLSRRLDYVWMGESTTEPYSRRIIVRVDGGRQVDVDVDGTLELLKPEHERAADRAAPADVPKRRRLFTDSQIAEISREFGKRAATARRWP